LTSFSGFDQAMSPKVSIQELLEWDSSPDWCVHLSQAVLTTVSVYWLGPQDDDRQAAIHS